MKYVLYILVGVTALDSLGYGFNLAALSGRIGQYLGGTLSAAVILYLIGGLIIIPGLIGLIMNKNWGKVVATMGMAMDFLAAVLTMTTGNIPIIQLVLPIISLILLYVIKK